MTLTSPARPPAKSPAEGQSLDALLSSYQFQLPEGCIAQHPLERRDSSRLLAVARDQADSRDLQFTDLPSILEPGDLLIVNDTQVLPARMFARKHSGGTVEILLIRALADGSWSALVRPSARVRPGSRLQLERRGDQGAKEAPHITIGESLADGQRRVFLAPEDQSAKLSDLTSVANSWGEMPLPPYIQRTTGPSREDHRRYQTLFANTPGAVAAPTAGLHFSEQVLDALAKRGIERSSVTLHVGLGTFQPVRTEQLSGHSMHRESYRVPVECGDAIRRCEDRGGRLIAVGTTVCRSLESWHRAGRPDDGALRSTDLFLRPGDPARLPLSLLTNFHLPGSTLIMLVASFLGRQRTLNLYQQAANSGYRFYSYGDAMLIL